MSSNSGKDRPPAGGKKGDSRRGDGRTSDRGRDRDRGSGSDKPSSKSSKPPSHRDEHRSGSQDSVRSSSSQSHKRGKSASGKAPPASGQSSEDRRLRAEEKSAAADQVRERQRERRLREDDDRRRAEDRRRRHEEERAREREADRRSRASPPRGFAGQFGAPLPMQGHRLPPPPPRAPTGWWRPPPLESGQGSSSGQHRPSAAAPGGSRGAPPDRGSSRDRGAKGPPSEGATLPSRRTEAATTLAEPAQATADPAALQKFFGEAAALLNGIPNEDMLASFGINSPDPVDHQFADYIKSLFHRGAIGRLQELGGSNPPGGPDVGHLSANHQVGVHPHRNGTVGLPSHSLPHNTTVTSRHVFYTSGSTPVQPAVTRGRVGPVSWRADAACGRPNA